MCAAGFHRTAQSNNVHLLLSNKLKGVLIKLSTYSLQLHANNNCKAVTAPQHPARCTDAVLSFILAFCIHLLQHTLRADISYRYTQQCRPAILWLPWSNVPINLPPRLCFSGHMSCPCRPMSGQAACQTCRDTQLDTGACLSLSIVCRGKQGRIPLAI
jgi:hypothetical protein